MKMKQIVIPVIISMLLCAIGFNRFVSAETQINDESPYAFSVSPMNQKISLIPGERTYGTFKVTNPNSSQNNFHFILKVEPFSVDDDYNIKFDNNGDYNQIVNWITLEGNEAEIPPNNTAVVHFYIDTPEDAPAGGQYAVIVVETAGDEDAKEGLNVRSHFGITHAIFAEVAGETERKGEIVDLKVPSFMFSGIISGTATVRNTGNVHGDAKYILQVFPLFSKEEIYTNEEENDSNTNTIIAGATRTTKVSWQETPKVGIFHVIYTVNFEGVEKKVDKYVIICPIWLLIVILTLIFLIIIKIVFTGKKEKKEK